MLNRFAVYYNFRKYLAQFTESKPVNAFSALEDPRFSWPLGALKRL